MTNTTPDQFAENSTRKDVRTQSQLGSLDIMFGCRQFIYRLAVICFVWSGCNAIPYPTIMDWINGLGVFPFIFSFFQHSVKFIDVLLLFIEIDALDAFHVHFQRSSFRFFFHLLIKFSLPSYNSTLFLSKLDDRSHLQHTN